MRANSGGRGRWRPRRTTSALGGSGGFKLVLSQRYLLLIGLLTLAVQIVNTNGNYILNETLARMAQRHGRRGHGTQTEGQIIGSFMAGVDFWQNVLSMAIQFFLVSRIFKYLGIGGALFVLPAIALGSYGLFAFAPVLAFIRIDEDHRERHGLFAAEHCPARAVPAHVARSEVQGAPGRGDLLLAGRRYALGSDDRS